MDYKTLRRLGWKLPPGLSREFGEWIEQHKRYGRPKHANMYEDPTWLAAIVVKLSEMHLRTQKAVNAFGGGLPQPKPESSPHEAGRVDLDATLARLHDLYRRECASQRPEHQVAAEAAKPVNKYKRVKVFIPRHLR